MSAINNNNTKMHQHQAPKRELQKSKLRPVSIDELEAEFCSRFPPDGSLELLGESWRRVRSILTKSLKELQNTLKLREETDDYNDALNHPHHHHHHLNNNNGSLHHHHTSASSVVHVEEIGPATVELFLLLGVTTPSGLAAAGGDRGMDGMMFTPGAAPHSSPNFLSVLPDPASILLASTPPNQRANSSSPTLSPSSEHPPPHHATNTTTNMDGGIVPSAIPLVPATNVLDLVDFTARYTSLGGEYSQSMRLPWCGVLSTLIGLVQLEADFLEGDDVCESDDDGIVGGDGGGVTMGGKSVQSVDPIDQQLTSTQRHNADTTNTSNNTDNTATGVKSLLPFEAVSKLTTFFAKVSEVMANCCSNASETRSDWALLPFRNHPNTHHIARDTPLAALDEISTTAAPPLLQSSSSSDRGGDNTGLRVQVGFPPFALAETAARVWGGSIAIALLWYDLLTNPPTINDDGALLPPRTDSIISSGGVKKSPKGSSGGRCQNSQMVPSRRLEFLELGCGCALPSCTMAKILLHHLHPSGDCTDQVGEPSSISEALIKSGATVNLTVSDWQQVIVTQAVQNVKKNWSATAVLNPHQAAINLSVLTAPRLSVEGQVLDFFAINSPTGPYSDNPNAGITPPPNTSAPPPPCVYDLVFGSDIVYDFKIGAEVATSLKHLLRKPSDTTTPFHLLLSIENTENTPSSSCKRRVLGELLTQVFTAGSSVRNMQVVVDAAAAPPMGVSGYTGGGDEATSTSKATTMAVVPDNLGGIALVCCERHRDGMLLFREQVERAGLQVLLHTEDAEADLLQQFAFPTTTTETSCAVYVIAHAPLPPGGSGGLGGDHHHHQAGDHLQEGLGSFEHAEECIDT